MYTLNDINLPSTIEEQESFFALVGFARNGPVNTPFTINDSASPYDILGDCPLADAYTAAKLQGVTPLLLRLNGSYATRTLSVGEVPVLEVKSIEAHDDCNEIKVDVYPTHLYIEGLNSSKAYLFSEYPTVSKLVDAINFDAYYGLSEVTAEALSPITLTNTLATTPYGTRLEKGDDGAYYMSSLDGSDTSDIFTRQVQLIQSSLLDGDTHSGELAPFNVDTIVIPDVPYELAPTLADVLGTYCLSKTEDQVSYCSGLLGSFYFQEEPNEEYVYDTEVQDLIAKGNSGKIHDKYEHIEIVLGMEEVINGALDKMSIVTKYAAMRYLLLPYLSSTNKEIKEISTFFTRFNKEQLASLTSNGYTCIVPSIRKGHVAYKSVSFIGNQTLIASKPHYSRSARYYVNSIVSPLESLIGSPSSQLQVANIDRMVKESVEQIKSLGIYKDIEYSTTLSSYDEIKISLSFLPYGEIESVQSTAYYDAVRKTVITWN